MVPGTRTGWTADALLFIHDINLHRPPEKKIEDVLFADGKTLKAF